MKRGNAAKNGKKDKTPPVSKDPKFFETAFQKRLDQSPTDYLVGKIQSGSSVSSVEYLFDIVSAEIASKNHCECKRLCLEKLYDKFYTARGAQLAQERRKIAEEFYENLYQEVSIGYSSGQEILRKRIWENE